MANMFGGATDLYKNRFSSELEQLKYDVDDYVIYPDVVRRRWMWHQPVGGAVFSGTDFPSGSTTAGVAGVSQKVQFNIPNNTVTDPTSYRFNFKCYVGDNTGVGSAGTTALCNYAHSVINQLTVRFTGSASTIIEQVPSYNIFCSMLYQFYSSNYVVKFHSALEGYNLTNANRAWNGRSFMLPLNVGFFLTLRKYIPNFCLPYLQIEFLMETVGRACCQKTVGTNVSAANLPYYYINSCQLIVSEVEVTSTFVDDMRMKVSQGQTADTEIRLDFTSWTFMSFQVPAGTTGQSRNLLTGNFVGIRKVMFGQIVNGIVVTGTSGSALNLGNDGINSFNLNNLQSYRLQIGGRYYPDQEVYLNYGQTASSTALTTDVSQGVFFNMYAIGCQNNNWSDFIQSWNSSDTFTSGVEQSTDFVMIISTEFDDSGLPVLTDMVNSGPLALVLNYGLAVPTNGVTVYVYVNTHRAIHIYDGNRATIIEG